EGFPKELPSGFRRGGPGGAGVVTGSLLGRTEVNFGSYARAFGGGEVVVIPFESGPPGKNAVGELADVGVVILNSFVIPATLDGDAVLASGQFVLQGCEVP